MRMRKNRVQKFSLRNRITEKDREGITVEKWGPDAEIPGELWPAGGKVQAEVYGQRLAYILNGKIQGDYTIAVDEKGGISYQFNGFSVREGDGICFHVPAQSDPDYKIISIKPYRPLYMELEKRL